MFKDEQRCAVWNELRQRDIRAFSGKLSPAVFQEAASEANVKVGNSPLNLTNLVWLGIASAMHATTNFANVLTTTLRILEDQQDFHQTQISIAKEKAKRKKKYAKHTHLPYRDDPTKVTEEAFTQARQLMPMSFWLSLIMILGDKFECDHKEQHQFHGFRVLAMDGTMIDVPNWKANKEYFGQAKNRTGLHRAQARMVMLQFPFTRMPYRYELSPKSNSEITMALRLVKHLRSRDLVLMDAGYWSYQLLWAIANQGAYFALRLRKRLSLKTIRLLEKNGRDRLVRWTPKDSRGKWRKLELPKSIDLRVVRYRVPGFRQQAIVTNVTDPKQISREDWTRLTTDCEQARRILLPPGLFHRRWEIEISFHELKVDLGMNENLRGRSPKSIEYEVAGYVTYYLLLRWLMVEAAVKHNLNPLRLSFVEAERELQTMYNALITATPRWASETLIPRLLNRIAEHQVAVRPGRHFPRNKNKKTKTIAKPKPRQKRAA